MKVKYKSKVENTIAKANSMVGEHIVYKLGAGGRNPDNLSPATFKDGVLACDCSGFVAWCWGFDRYQDNHVGKNQWDGKSNARPGLFGYFPYYGGWINTDSMLEDAFDSNIDWFSHLNYPIPGCIVAYGSTGEDNNKRIGHEGLVISTPEYFDKNNKEHWKKLVIIDCRSAKPAIAIRDGLTWFGNDRAGRPKQSQFCWPNFVMRNEK